MLYCSLLYQLKNSLPVIYTLETVEDSINAVVYGKKCEIRFNIAGAIAHDRASSRCHGQCPCLPAFLYFQPNQSMIESRWWLAVE